MNTNDTKQVGSAADIRTQVKVPPIVFGGEKYSISVEVLNSGPAPIHGIRIEAVDVPGIISDSQQVEEMDSSAILRARSRRIREELRTQAEYAMLFHRTVPGVFRRFFTPIYASVFDLMKNLSSKLEGMRLTWLPAWSRRSLDIYGIEDAEEIETALINSLPDNHPVRMAWELSIKKLRRLNNGIHAAEREAREGETQKRELLIGSSTTATFQIRAPFLFTQRKADAVFQVFYKGGQQVDERMASCRSEVFLSASPASVVAGAVIGAIGGFLVRFVYLTDGGVWFSNGFWQDLIASIILGFLFAALVRKTPESTKPLTA